MTVTMTLDYCQRKTPLKRQLMKFVSRSQRRISTSNMQSWMPIDNICQWTDPGTKGFKVLIVTLLLTGLGERENDSRISLEKSNTVLNIQGGRNVMSLF